MAGPVFTFNHDSSVNDFAVSKASYLVAHPDSAFGYIATSTLVMHTRIPFLPRVLLVQRAADDEDPNLWEAPGGACDDDDESILHAAARELYEEAGLEVEKFEGVVGEQWFFTLDDGKKVCQFTFGAKVKGDNGVTDLKVRLDPKEHQRFLWATAQEVREKKVGEVDLEFTSEVVERNVLAAFGKQ
ncbi:NUDIX hydrolase domain-like protein [Podospora fimiseda]|uniref:NUDIX hydrolase domain-like protein n=1 Tax=Podospora fimiseda TaxID=252190 RepID=A0AAN7BF24_9PEZI|nr:NUDIX hydrolase domain-like protein [Podospora fimiseda]